MRVVHGKEPNLSRCFVSFPLFLHILIWIYFHLIGARRTRQRTQPLPCYVRRQTAHLLWRQGGLGWRQRRGEGRHVHVACTRNQSVQYEGRAGAVQGREFELEWCLCAVLAHRSVHMGWKGAYVCWVVSCWKHGGCVCGWELDGSQINTGMSYWEHEWTSSRCYLIVGCPWAYVLTSKGGIWVRLVWWYRTGLMLWLSIQLVAEFIQISLLLCVLLW